jgi:antitoxin HigA-1
MTTTDTDEAAIGPIHPGEHLEEDFLKPLGITPYRLAKDIDVPPNRITAIIAGERDITADTALRLGRYFGTSAQSWINLQTAYDLEVAAQQIAGDLERIEPRAA